MPSCWTAEPMFLCCLCQHAFVFICCFFFFCGVPQTARSRWQSKLCTRLHTVTQTRWDAQTSPHTVPGAAYSSSDAPVSTDRGDTESALDCPDGHMLEGMLGRNISRRSWLAPCHSAWCTRRLSIRCQRSSAHRKGLRRSMRRTRTTSKSCAMSKSAGRYS